MSFGGMKVFVIVGEYYEEETGGFVSNIFHGVFGTKAEAELKLEEAISQLAGYGVKDYTLEIREQTIKF